MIEPQTLRIETDHAALVFAVDGEGRLSQRSFGSFGAVEGEVPAFPTAGDGWVYEPALRVVHADGNTSLDLRVVSTSQEDGLTRIETKDPAYPFYVNLLFRTFPEVDVFEAWTEIRHEEEDEVVLEAYASSAPDFGLGEAWLTQFRGDWNDEANMEEERLGYGTKVLDSKLIVRANQFRAPWFLLARGGTAREDQGEVFGGSLAWSGSFRFAFERLPQGSLRAICGINPAGSAYRLVAGERFETPRMVWGWSGEGTGRLSRNLHAWVRRHALRDGDRPRSVLLNNWEATYFTFDEAKIVSLLDGADALGMELFLLDDGWFGRKYPRDGDDQGLGDWTPDPKKLPNGLEPLTRAAEARGVRFGLWLEPEMVSPRSELYEAHPEWAIGQPHRTPEPQRNQLVLDLSRPEVREYVFELVDRTLAEHPGITYVKWDCNRFVTQPGSPYLSAREQSHLAVVYPRALDEILDRLTRKHPNVEIMMCSGGGGRVDYGSTRHAQEFWPSDNTDPARRVFIQWGYDHFFPPLAVAAHVTHMGERSLKFAFEVAMSARLGMDLDVSGLDAEGRAFAARAIEAYKTIRETVQLGTRYRLASPYAGPRSAVMSLSGDEAVVFVYSLGDSVAAPLRLKGLDEDSVYEVRELLGGFSGTFAGSALMSEGLPLPAYGEFESAVFALRALRS